MGKIKSIKINDLPVFILLVASILTMIGAVWVTGYAAYKFNYMLDKYHLR